MKNEASENKQKKAAALSYQADTDPAPRISAKGSGWVAEEIIARAKKHGVPIQEDATLTELLQAFETGRMIPPELYEAVAEIFLFIYNLDKESR